MARRLALVVVPLLIICVCCDVPAWPTLVWQAVVPSCGHLTLSYLTYSTPQSEVAQAGQCFVRAYQRCSAASLSVTFQGIDLDTVHEFVIEPFAYTCAIGELWTEHNFHFPPYTFSGYCSSLRQEGDGLRFEGCPSGWMPVLPNG